MKRIKIAHVDDHPAIAEQVRASLDEVDGVELIASVSSGSQLFETVDLKSIHIVLVDLRMPHMDGIEVSRRIRANFPALKIIIVSSNINKTNLRALEAFQINGFVYKGSIQPENLEEAITKVMEGEVFLDRNVLEMAYLQLAGKQTKKIVTFTNTEIVLAPFLIKEMKYKDIGKLMFRSHKTIEGIASLMRRKTSTENNVELVKYLLDHPELWSPRK